MYHNHGTPIVSGNTLPEVTLNVFPSTLCGRGRGEGVYASHDLPKGYIIAPWVPVTYMINDASVPYSIDTYEKLKDLCTPDLTMREKTNNVELVFGPYMVFSHIIHMDSHTFKPIPISKFNRMDSSDTTFGQWYLRTTREIPAGKELCRTYRLIEWMNLAPYVEPDTIMRFIEMYPGEKIN